MGTINVQREQRAYLALRRENDRLRALHDVRETILNVILRRAYPEREIESLQDCYDLAEEIRDALLDPACRPALRVLAQQGDERCFDGY